MLYDAQENWPETRDRPLPPQGRGSIVTTDTPIPVWSQNQKRGNMSTRATKRSRVVKWTGAAVLFGSVAATAPAAVVNAASAKNNLIIGINEPNAAWCTQDSPGIDQVAAKNSVLETLTIVNDKGKMVPYTAKSVTKIERTTRSGRLSFATGSSIPTERHSTPPTC